jgi:hypothetical protein
MYTGTMPEEERRHVELIEAVEGLASALREIGKPPDVVVNVPKSPAPQVILDQASKPCSYEFVVYRDKDNRIQSIVATPIE